jgi:lipopolysaccharide/colanic/teichoic acid biosynthesis glycosyltransferase
MFAPPDIQTATLPLSPALDAPVRDSATPPPATAARPIAPSSVGVPPSLLLRQSWYVAGKPVLDFAIALLLCVPALPILLVTALLVKLTSRGPVLYSQVRLGKNGRPFSMYKVRTMAHNCEKTSGARWCIPGDPRVTPLGRILRATHLDELPQLWNILRGEMSLVGPRPERPEFVPALERAIPHYRGRLQVRPGVSGLAQVQLPPDTDIPGVRRKLAHDLYYIRHFSGWLDLRILACTVLHLSGIPCHKLCRALLTTAREPLPEERTPAGEAIAS